MDTSSAALGPRATLVVALLFVANAVVMAADVAADARAGAKLDHLGGELAVFCVALVGAVVGLRAWRTLRLEAQDLRDALHHSRKDAERAEADARKWRQEARDIVGGLSQAIDRELDRWGLSAAERQVAMLLLKGLSHKEIAHVRGTSERTARDQARAVYKKAGLGGRADLAAYFLEDLLELPATHVPP